MRERLGPLVILILSLVGLSVKGGNWAAMAFWTVALSAGVLAVSGVIDGHLLFGLLLLVIVPVEVHNAVKTALREVS